MVFLVSIGGSKQGGCLKVVSEDEREARKAEIEEEMGETGVAEPREEPRAAAGLFEFEMNLRGSKLSRAEIHFFLDPAHLYCVNLPSSGRTHVVVKTLALILSR